MKKYQHIIFDFDNTLWDFATNSKESLLELYNKHQKLQQKFGSFENFYNLYEKYNIELWKLYRKGEVSKDGLSTNRFAFPLREVGIRDIEYATKLNSEYLALTTTKTKLKPYAIDVLKYLKSKGYNLHILTDGFFEVQFLKLKTSKLIPYITHIIVSEEVGFLKPDSRLFQYMTEKIGADKSQMIMVGDDYENDIIGAYNFGMDQVFYNIKNLDIDALPIKPTYTIFSLIELKDIL